MKPEPRVAFVTDALPSIGGGEKVLFTALEVFPCADVFTLIYNRPAFACSPLANRKVKTSLLDQLPLAHKHHRFFLPLMPSAIERFDLRGYELIVSFSYAVAHGVFGPNDARHVSYTYTPMRYAWHRVNINGTISPDHPAIAWFMQNFRKWDRLAVGRVHEIAAISHAIAERIWMAYQREARVIYPPVETGRFRPSGGRGDFYVIVSRLVAHKRIDLIVEAFSRLNLPLVIVGEGPELKRLQAASVPNIQFLGHQPDEKVADLLGQARGFVCAAEEDFGIAIVEAQAAGCPVIAYGRGGARETVLDGRTGLLFPEQTVESLMGAIREFERACKHFRVDEIIENARKFDQSNFKREFMEFVLAGWL
jgi:glycosyltransferase involved in cell wall biosynthesis